MELWDESNPEEEGWVFNQSGTFLDLPNHPPTPLLYPPKAYKSKSKSFPILQGNLNIWAFVIQVTKEIEATNWRLGPCPNLPVELKKALKSLRMNRNIIIKPSDKDGNLVIMNVEGYEKMCYDIIHNGD